jgi:hypothetical protein
LNGVSGQIAPLFNVNTLASGGTNVFQIAASGAASFSNTVTANSGFVSSTGLTSGSSTYGPTSATVNGNIVAQNALITEANGIGSYITGNTGAAGLLWNGTAGGGEATLVTAYNGGVTASFWRWNGSTYARSSVINSDGTYYNGSSYGPSSFTVAMGGSGQTSITGVPNNGIRITPNADGVGATLYGTNAVNTIIQWNITDNGTFYAGPSGSLYGPTSAYVNGYIDANGSVIIGGQGTANTGVLYVTALSSLSNPGAIYGDITAQRSASTGVLWLGGASSSVVLDYNITNSGNLTSTRPLQIGSSIYGPTSATVNGTVSATNVNTTTFTASLNAGTNGFPAGNNSYAGLAWNGSSAQAEATIFTSFSSPGRTASFWYYNGSSYVQSSYIQTNGTYVSASDKTLKENIQPLAMGLKEVLALKPSSFTWKDNRKADHGFIAQEVQEVIPAAVEPMYSKDGKPDTNGILGMSYTHIIPVLVNAIQELKAELDLLKAAKNATA